MHVYAYICIVSMSMTAAQSSECYFTKLSMGTQWVTGAKNIFDSTNKTINIWRAFADESMKMANGKSSVCLH